MATIRWYLDADNLTNGGWEALRTTAPGALTLSGWVVGTGATFSAEYAQGVTRASTTFVANTVPDGTLDVSLKDAFRTATPLNGAFASGNWTFQFAVVSSIQAGAADGQIVFRLIKANADGSSATEITSAQQTASVCTNVLSTPDSNSTLTFNPGAFTLTNQYLFIQVAWKRTGAGGMTTTDIRVRSGVNATTGTTILSADFTAVQSVTASFVPAQSFPFAPSVRRADVTAPPIHSFLLVEYFDLYKEPFAADVAADADTFVAFDDESTYGQSFHVSARFSGLQVSVASQVATDGTWALAIHLGDQLGTIVATASLPVALPGDLTPRLLTFTFPTVDPGGTSTLYTWTLQRLGATNNTVFLPYAQFLAPAGNPSYALYHGDPTWYPYADYHYVTRILGESVFAPSVALGAGADQAVTGATLASGSVVRVPTVVAAQAITAGTIPTAVDSLLLEDSSFVLQEDGSSHLLLDGAAAGAAQTFPPTVTPGGLAQAVTTAPIASTLALFAPSVTTGAVTITTATIAPTAQLFPPTVVPQAVTITTAHRASTLQLFAPSVTTGPVAVTTAHRPTTQQLFAPSLAVGPASVTTASRASTLQLFAPSVTVGAVSITTATIPSTAQLFAPSVTAGAVAITTGTRPSTLTLFAPSLAVGPTAVITAALASTAQLFPPALAVGATTITTAPLGPLASLFPPTVLGAGVIGGPTLGPLATLFPPTVTTGPVGITTGTRVSTLALFPPSVVAPLPTPITTVFLGATTALFPPSVTAGAAAIATGPLASTALLFPPSVTTGATTLVTGPLGSTALLFPPALNILAYAGAVTQLVTEAFTTQAAAARATQLALEAFTTRTAAVRATQLAVEVFFPRPVEARVTQQVVELFCAQPAAAAVTSAIVELFTIPGAPPSNACSLPLPIDPAEDGGTCPPAFFDPDSEETWH